METRFDTEDMKASTPLKTMLSILVGVLIFSSRAHADTITPRTEFDSKGRVVRQYFIYTKQGAKPVVIEHGLDLPTFNDPESYSSDVQRFRRDSYSLKMLDLGVAHGVIKDVPYTLKGDKFREWLKSEAIQVENSMCSNPGLRAEIIKLMRNAMEVPPPPKTDDFDRFSIPPDAKPPKATGTTT